MKVFFDALGCPKAIVDAERMLYFLEKEKHELVTDPEEADAVIVNSCGFIEKAKQESIDAVLQYAEIKKRKPGMKLVLSGCLTERYKTEILDLIPEIDGALGVRDPRQVVRALEKGGRNLADAGEWRDTDFAEERSLAFSGGHWAYLKISEGCSRQCAFCAIPGIRGKQRSRPTEDIVREARFLLDSGIEEIILVSEDTMSYGFDIYGRKSLLPLLETLAELPVARLRVMYLFPEEGVLDVVRFLVSRKNVAHYADIPFQHASRKILRAMLRPGDAEEYLELLAGMRRADPELRIRSSFIVGFPGETDEDFRILEDFIRRARFDRVGFFEYSHEEGTPSFALPDDVSAETVQARISALSVLQQGISRERLSELVGHELVCLSDGEIERKRNVDWLIARTEYDAPEIDGTVRVKLPAPEGRDPPSGMLRVKISAVRGFHDLEGELSGGGTA
jgi:ribosomal protein S12 methylthiotransferase